MSQTDEGPAIQGGIDFNHESGIFAGIWASNVEYDLPMPRENPRNIELDYYLGYEHRFARDWAGTLLVIFYTYPDSSVNYNYTEFAGGISYHEIFYVNIAHTNDWLSLGSSATDYEAIVQYPLGRGFEFGGTLGYFNVDLFFVDNYLYWNIGLSKMIDRFTVDARYHDTDDQAIAAFGDIAGGRWVFSISAAF